MEGVGACSTFSTHASLFFHAPSSPQSAHPSVGDDTTTSTRGVDPGSGRELSADEAAPTFLQDQDRGSSDDAAKNKAGETAAGDTGSLRGTGDAGAAGTLSS